MPDREACLRAVRSRESRFDGVFFTAVRTTGIYCRPSCPAVTPKDANMTFYPSAAAAVAAGYRACRRCRPDASPGSPEWDVRGDVVARAMRLVRDGVVDREGVPGLAGRLGYSARQLERLMLAELGAGPAALARAQRAYTARLLIESTGLPLGDVAFAAGFSSIRAFNEAVAQVYATTPTELRARSVKASASCASARPQRWAMGAEGPGRRVGASGLAPGSPAVEAGAGAMVVRLRLPRRDPFVADNLFGHLAATAVPGIEEWRDGAYRTTLRLPVAAGLAALTPRSGCVAAELMLADPRDLAPAIARCRALLDLDADPEAIGAVLGADPALGRPWRDAPGRRVPRSVDAGEFALRAVLGQQISVARAANLTARLVTELGDPIVDPRGGLSRLFPSFERLADLNPAELPMPRARGRAFVGLAQHLADGSLDLSPGCDRDRARARLAELPGIGPWTVEVIALRGLGDPDAFPGSDLGVRKGLEHLGLDPSAAEQWRPWRAYAVQYLWASDAQHAINRLPGSGPGNQEAS
ncbi:AlkA N-terminal domain-containing protein [Granulicoccus sp. GXG6511]|uniref:AlkA N-terminal domain-containing protein n=1 Tax=Granulicoccus sp. GXG6511 TaxID=3381351 RepID=UPI003D7DAC73